MVLTGLFVACSPEWLVSFDLGLTVAFCLSQVLAISSSFSPPGAGEASWLLLPLLAEPSLA